MNALQNDLKLSIQNAQRLYAQQVNQDPFRLHYHLMPPIGWLNDPNGVCFYKGYYHLFYQYAPIDASGGLKFWGHYRSKDMVSFEDLGVAMYPDQPYDLHGVYSGSAVIENDEMHLFYTGNIKKAGNYDYINDGREQHTIHAVCKDGEVIEKLGIVIDHSEYPEGFSTHIRDPKVWKEQDTYYMVLGARDIDGQGQVILYRSSDLNKWEYMGVSAGPIDGMGYMWECPDYFKLGDKDVLLISPQGISPQGDLYQNIYQSGYMIGDLDLITGKFTHNEFVEIDRGFDFYAPQTFQDPNGRRIMWAWMGLPDIEDEHYSNPTVEHGWQHAMTLPRELQLVGDKLIQKPLEELKSLRGAKFDVNVEVDGYTVIDELKGEIFEMIVDVNDCDTHLDLLLREDAAIRYNAADKKVTLTLGPSGFGRTQRSVTIDTLKKLQIFSDSSSLEIFINDGEEVFTTRIYPKCGSDKIHFDGKGTIYIQKWDMK